MVKVKHAQCQASTKQKKLKHGHNSSIEILTICSVALILFRPRAHQVRFQYSGLCPEE